MKILIVDDEIFARRTLQRLLTHDDDSIEIIEAEDCYDAYAMYEEFRPDLVITDIMMKGGIGGEWLIEKILTLDKNAKIIVCSGRQKTELLKYKLMGAKHCLHKPVKYDELWECINDIL